jgi:DNA-binding XRE family transcriptional regulator
MPKKRPAAAAATKPDPTIEPPAVDSDAFLAAVGALIRETRVSKGLSAVQCAKAANVARPTWYHFESGRSIGLDKLPHIAAALGVKVGKLIPANF